MGIPYGGPPFPQPNPSPNEWTKGLVFKNTTTLLDYSRRSGRRNKGEGDRSERTHFGSLPAAQQ